MGTLAFLCCMGFLALDVYFPQISSVKDRKKAVMADIGVSAFWSFMWFVGFCSPGQPVAGGQARGQPTEGGWRRNQSRHCILLLLHLHLGGADCAILGEAKERVI
ncbi:hypothetical protein SKAU_G00299510 [Synaphobranchus kaupii]|uniref:Uncharacterized protein n=1 Tax=Synaphobranchus kaupii TaxID=118154 RepID=A0A9Q1EVG0_SYNKA|nr:hypothetical protein SKAU_G00299510 [Synaphobranchus kaupii]